MQHLTHDMCHVTSDTHWTVNMLIYTSVTEVTVTEVTEVTVTEVTEVFNLSNLIL